MKFYFRSQINNVNPYFVGSIWDWSTWRHTSWHNYFPGDQSWRPRHYRGYFGSHLYRSSTG